MSAKMSGRITSVVTESVDTVEYLVAFRSGDRSEWLPWLRCVPDYVLRPGFGHVSIMWRCPVGENYLLAEYVMGGVDVWSIPAFIPRDNAIRSMTNRWGGAGIRWVSYTCQANKAQQVLRGHLNCVGLVKAILGLRCWRVWTPYQLYVRLLASGAVEHV